VDGHDGSPRPKVGVADQGIQLSSSLDETLMDLMKAFALLRGVAVWKRAQVTLLEARPAGEMLRD
jgi:hypothetical protein